MLPLAQVPEVPEPYEPLLRRLAGRRPSDTARPERASGQEPPHPAHLPRTVREAVLELTRIGPRVVELARLGPQTQLPS